MNISNIIKILQLVDTQTNEHWIDTSYDTIYLPVDETDPEELQNQLKTLGCLYHDRFGCYYFHT